LTTFFKLLTFYNIGSNKSKKKEKRAFLLKGRTSFGSMKKNGFFFSIQIKREDYELLLFIFSCDVNIDKSKD